MTMPTTEPEKEFREAFRELITMAETVRATGRVCHWGGLALEALGLPVTDIRNGGVTDIDDDATDTNDNITDTEALDFPVTDTYYGNDTDTERPDEEGGEPGQRQTRRPRGEMRQRIVALLGAHPEGLSAEQIRVYLQAEKPLGDTLQGMRRQGKVHTRGQGKDMRYGVA
jgi:hypothetical protein